MKSVCLFTKTKITADKVSQKIINCFKWKKRIVQNDEIELFLGYFPHEFYIVYSDSCDIDDPDCLFDESDKKQVPFNNSQVNEIFYRDESVAKFVVNIIFEEYPELIIMDDDGNMMTAQKFING